MKSTTYNYLQNSGLIGATRTRVLQKVLAAAVAYATPCVVGSISDRNEFYRKLCLPAAMKVISEVNEITIIDVDSVLKDVNLLWCGRYDMLNSPLYCDSFDAFKSSMETAGEDVSQHYRLWIESFYAATSGVVSKMDGGL